MSNSDAEYRAFSEQFLHKGKIKELLKKEKKMKKYKFKIEGKIEVLAENEIEALENARMNATIEGGWDIIKFIPLETNE